jgi:hypothetical protein
VRIQVSPIHEAMAEYSYGDEEADPNSRMTTQGIASAHMFVVLPRDDNDLPGAFKQSRRFEPPGSHSIRPNCKRSDMSLQPGLSYRQARTGDVGVD